MRIGKISLNEHVHNDCVSVQVNMPNDLQEVPRACV